MEKSSYDNERLKQARLEKLGTNNPICGMCGENRWWHIEQHHIAGQKRDTTVGLICVSCHCDVTKDQKDHLPFDPEADSLLDTVGNFLLGLADMLKKIVEKLYEFGNALIERSKCQSDLTV